MQRQLHALRMKLQLIKRGSYIYLMARTSQPRSKLVLLVSRLQSCWKAIFRNHVIDRQSTLQHCTRKETTSSSSTTPEITPVLSIVEQPQKPINLARFALAAPCRCCSCWRLVLVATAPSPSTLRGSFVTLSLYVTVCTSAKIYSTVLP